MEDNDLELIDFRTGEVNDADRDPEEFVSLGELLVVKPRQSARVLATAIETHGIQGLDRYGRFRSFLMGSDEAKRALEALAAEAAYEWSASFEPDTSGPSPAEHSWAMNDGSDFYRYGWRRSEMPDLSKLEADEPPQPKALGSHSSKKAENATLRIVAALLMLVKGELTTVPHPQFTSEAELIGVLVDSMAGYGGLSRRNLETRFAEAKRALR